MGSSLILLHMLATLNLESYGGQADARTNTISVVSGNPSIQVVAGVTAPDAGKLILIFGAGPTTSGTNRQDYIGTISSVDGATNCTLAVAPSQTGDFQAVIGTQNVTALNAALAACQSTSDTIALTPNAAYLFVAPAMLTNYVMVNNADLQPCVILRRGGITFSGNGTHFLFCGAWKKLGTWAQRGCGIWIQGPITNDYPLVFNGITFDGGAADAFADTSRYFPASNIDGSGWDETHSALIDVGQPLHSSKVFTNCTFTHWKGEMVKSVTDWPHGFITFNNCVFSDGNASGINYTFSHDVNGCSFDRLQMAMEFYQGYAETNCLFRNSTITNVLYNGLVIVGALTNHLEPNYLITGNEITGSNSCILISPGANITISSNRFHSLNTGIFTTSSAYQGSDNNHDWDIGWNSFDGPGGVLLVGGGRADDLVNCLIHDNSAAAGGYYFASGYGTCTNVLLVRNSGSRWVDGHSIVGDEYFRDDLSNTILPQTHDAPSQTLISYAYGARHKLMSTTLGAVWQLKDSDAAMIPPGAVLSVWNAASSAVRLWMSDSTYPNCYSQSIAAGITALFTWTGTSWQPADRIDAGTVVVGGLRGQ